jgi:hypothetical protein
MVIEARMLLVIEVVEEADDAPKLFFLRGTSHKFSSVRTHTCLDRQRMFAQAF